jgi:FeS assembly SUF system protein
MEEFKPASTEPADAPASQSQPPVSSQLLDAAGVAALREKVVEALKTCFDPEIPVNIYELGLIYDIQVEPAAAVTVKMTLTSPACPAARTLPGEVEDKIYIIAKAKDVKVEVVWEPPWETSRMSEAAKLQLGMM